MTALSFQKDIAVRVKVYKHIYPDTWNRFLFFNITKKSQAIVFTCYFVFFVG